MDKLITCETDRGRYAVRPMSWAGIWNEKGQIKESLNHLALFIKKEDAEKFVEWKNAEEQNRLLKLPCAVGDTVYEICERFIEPCTVEVIFIADYKDKEGNSSFMAEIYYDREDCPWVSTEIYFTDIGKTVFLTREEAEAALEELER